jgi:diguanylate cyclase (GGDEF)-like protein/PAS domain S-box-containing protein
MTSDRADVLDTPAQHHLHFSSAAQRILDGVPEVILTLSYPELKIIYANSTACLMFLSTHGTSEIVGKDIVEFGDRDRQLLWHGYIDQAVRTGLCETDHLGPDNERQWRLRLEPLLSDGRCVGVGVIGQDMTDIEAVKVQLAETEGMYLSLFEAMGVGAVFQGSDGRIIAVNKAAEEILCRTAAQLMGLTSDAPDWDAIKEDGSPFPGHEHPSMVTLRTSEPQLDVYMGIKRPDGERRWILINSQPVLSGRNRELKAVIGTFHDVTEKRAMREQLKAKVAELDHALSALKAAEATRQREQVRFRSAVQAAPTAMIMVDPIGTIILANDRADMMFGFERGALIGQPLNLLLPLDAVSSHDAYRQQFLRAPEERSMGNHREIYARHKDGSEFRVEIGLTPITDEAGHFVLASITDLRAQLDAQHRIERLTNFDPLTGLPNRTYFRDHVANALAEGVSSGHKLAVLVIDLDNFKYVNDNLSHRAGDRLLVGVAKRLAALEVAGGTAARLGSDEFALALPFKGQAELFRQASFIQADMARPHLIEDTEIVVSVSIGIAVSPGDGSTVEALIQNAETAMHRAKDEGRNGFRLFATDMHRRGKRLLALETGLHTALDRRQFYLCYQPQFDSSGDRIIGIEALIRWQHPELGAVSPSEFIPLAERNGQIVQIGRWVLETAIAQMKMWSDAGIGAMSISVNLSALQFRQKDLPTDISRILRQTGLPPAQLELELTETAAMDDPMGAMLMMQQLREIGVKIAIDDFGTGYSSLGYLKKFKIDKLKIDQSFVGDIMSNDDDRSIVRSIINLGHNLGFQTIAEGVETADQFEFLRREGCDLFQGYYFARPLTADEMSALLQGALQGN